MLLDLSFPLVLVCIICFPVIINQWCTVWIFMKCGELKMSFQKIQNDTTSINMFIYLLKILDIILFCCWQMALNIPVQWSKLKDWGNCFLAWQGPFVPFIYLNPILDSKFRSIVHTSHRNFYLYNFHFFPHYIWI